MYILTVEDHFASAHQLREYKGKCENLHGHNWRVELKVKGETLGNSGMLIDFGDLKKMLKEILSDVDHKNLNEVAPFDVINPTSENLAAWLSGRVQTELAKGFNGVNVSSIIVWESHTSRCEFIPD
jgi:6-pyruvoyltetrahydropterin/6-carboxytetrahydropterin synthase